ncbi:MAG: type I 3-dehydroquinate dehydratase [Lachnospiraceae bacterium]
MKPMKVRNVSIGVGMPKICVPVVGRTKEEIINEMKEIKATDADMVEWRVDWFEDVANNLEVGRLLEQIRTILEDMPLLFTFRSFREGGNFEVTDEVYENLNIFAVETGCVDLIDVELFFGAELIERVRCRAHAANVKIVISNHDFHNTPPKKEIIKRLTRMKELGADIAKMAVMPSDKQDVLCLMAATVEMTEHDSDCLVVTMSMSEHGLLSRISGEITGSAITFGALIKASAPGQIPITDLSKLLNIIHRQSGQKGLI